MEFKTQRHRLTTLLVGVALLGTAGCAANPADNVPKAGAGTPSQAATTAPVAAASSPTPAPSLSGSPVASATPGATGSPTAASGTVMSFVEGTEVGFKASKVTRSHDGGFKGVTGSVTVPGDEIDKSVVDVIIDMASVYSDDEKLTEHLVSPDFFDVAKYPTATFKSTSISRTDDGYLVTGKLNLHGVSKSINFPAEITINGSGLNAKAEFSINRQDFKIVYPGKPDDFIRDEVVLKFDLKAAAAAQG